MILAKVHTTPKQRDEFRLLVAIRFACLMALAKGHTDPMDCPRVQARCNELVKHFAYHHPSAAFYRQFIRHTGELGLNFCLRFTEPQQGLYGKVMVWRNDSQAVTNVHPLHTMTTATPVGR